MKDANLSNFVSGLAGAIFGAAATFYANLLMERVKARDDGKARQKNIALSMKLEFEACLKCLDELKRSLNNQNIYSLRWTKVFRNSIEGIEKLRQKLYVLNDPLLQEELSVLATDLSLFVADVESLESWWLGLQQTPPVGPNGLQLGDADKKDQEDYVKEQRRLKLVELVDLKRRLDEAVKDLSNRAS